MSDSAPGTSVSLLARLREAPQDQSVWRTFVARYEPRIQAWCRAWGLQDADVHDVTQNVLLRLAGRMRTFAYDPTRSFRAWLKTLTRHAWSDFVHDQQRPGARGCGSAEAERLLQSTAASDDLARSLESIFDQEVLEEARVRVEWRVDRQTWEVFRLTALENRPAVEVAAERQMTVAAVYKAKSRLLKMLQEEVRRLEGEEVT
jgi:RNA polymerase sigma-70 factor (ECF subfamily)